MPYDSPPSPPDLAAALEAAGLCIVDELTTPGRAARTVGAPHGLHTATSARLSTRFPGGLYAHQAEAISRGLAEDLCLATSTSSGKTLVFTALADDAITRAPRTRVLALYPMKALIEDQHQKWRSHFAGTDVEVTFIHGGVPVANRWQLLSRSNVVLMTPDVVQAWVLSSLRDPRMQRFLTDLGLLILDEAHAYEGVFGTNAAYLFRRLEAAARPFRLIASTATVDDPASFIRALTGRDVAIVGPERESSPVPARRFVLCRPAASNDEMDPHERGARLLRQLADRSRGCALAFADSRKGVERILRANDKLDGSADEVRDDCAEEVARRIKGGRLLPYRSGYENEDRRAIQTALSRGLVRGVVATSALELGIDIGEIDVAVMLNVPPTMKALRQRVGRAGRGAGPNDTALCLILDSGGVLPAERGTLAVYLARPVEPSRLYLDNRFVMFGHALCAARETQQAHRYDREAFETLPRAALFQDLIDNEVQPKRALDDDLLRLRQEVAHDPHHSLPLRSAGEVELQIVSAGPDARRLGHLTHSQALREAFPGAVYVHLGQPWRVQRWTWAQREVVVIPMTAHRHGRTAASRTDLVFPRVDHGSLLALRESRCARVFEAICQVSSRVKGFSFRPAPRARPEQHAYGMGSSWSQSVISRQFTTTCVAWNVGDAASSAAAAEAIRVAYCARLGIHEQDLGVGSWRLDGWRGDGKPAEGACIFDAVQGSLRLGQHLVELFPEVVTAALATARANEDGLLEQELERIGEAIGDLPPPVTIGDAGLLIPELHDNGGSPWLKVVRVGTRGSHTTTSGISIAVTVVGHRYTPRGVGYLVQREGVAGTELMLGSTLAFDGAAMVEWNTDTDETRELSPA